MMDVHLVVPHRSTDSLAESLVRLTRTLDEHGLADGAQGGFLGGEYGYGANYEDDVFMLHRYCWCEASDCPWCQGCECEVEYNEGTESYDVVGEKCDPCRGVMIGEDKGAIELYGAPNFWHKPSGVRVWWYKYIGRGMETYGDDPVRAVEAAIASLGSRN